MKILKISILVLGVTALISCGSSNTGTTDRNMNNRSNTTTGTNTSTMNNTGSTNRTTTGTTRTTTGTNNMNTSGDRNMGTTNDNGNGVRNTTVPYDATQNYNTLYNALNMTQAQRTQFEQLNTEYFETRRPNIKDTDVDVLREMQDNHLKQVLSPAQYSQYEKWKMDNPNNN